MPSGALPKTDDRPNLIEFIDGLLVNARKRIEERFKITFTPKEVQELESGFRVRYLHDLNKELMLALKARKKPEEVISVVFNYLSGSGVATQLSIEPENFNRRGIIKTFAIQTFRIMINMCLHDKDLIGSDLKADLLKIQGIVAALQGNIDGFPPSKLQELRMELGNSLIDPTVVRELLASKEKIETLGLYL